MSNPSSEASSKTVLILGDLRLESVNDKILALGHTFQIKSLYSSFSFWQEKENEKFLKQLHSSGDLLAVFMLLTKVGFLDSCRSDYFEEWQDLLIELKETNALFFISEDIYALELLDADFQQFGSRVDLLSKDFSKFITEDYIINKPGRISKFAEIMKEFLLIPTYFNNDGIYYTLESISNLDLIEKKLERLDDAFKHKKVYIIEEGYDLTINTALDELKQALDSLRNFSINELPEMLQRAKQLLKIIQLSGLEIVPYKTNTEISLKVHHFLDELDKGIFLHLYVPNGRYQEDQLVSFLRLFESYLQRVEHVQFSIESRKTLRGQIYEFKSKTTSMNMTDMEGALSRFEDFIGLCQYDQKQAEALLLRTGMNPSEASRLLTKYGKEYQRLLLDIEHERERKMLDLRQRLESDALELAHGASLTVTSPIQPSALLSLSPHADPISSFIITNSSVVINPGLQSYVEQAIYGDIHYTTEDKELLELFVKYAQGLESVRLRSDLEQLKDPSLPDVERKTAKQKIMGFLTAKVAPAIGQTALTVLTAYLEKVLTGS